MYSTSGRFLHCFRSRTRLFAFRDFSYQIWSLTLECYMGISYNYYTKLLVFVNWMVTVFLHYCTCLFISILCCFHLFESASVLLCDKWLMPLCIYPVLVVIINIIIYHHYKFHQSFLKLHGPNIQFRRYRFKYSLHHDHVNYLESNAF